MSPVPSYDSWAPPTSNQKLEEKACAWRHALGVDTGCMQPDMIEILELSLPQLVEPYSFLIAELEDGVEAYTRFKPAQIVLTTSVYQALVDKVPRARFTAAHELGHFVLHAKAKDLHRAPIDHIENGRLKAFCSAEWQADTFASRFLMPTQLVRTCSTALDVMKKFKVSQQAAKRRFRDVSKERLAGRGF